ncbi:MAG: AAA family ATPase [Bacteroidales bacterium]
MIINKIEIDSFGPISNKINWDGLSKINLIIGKNGSGKSFLLKALYCAIRTVETIGRGNDPRSGSEIIYDKLYWTFQPDSKIGELVYKGAESNLSFSISSGNDSFSYSFGRSTNKKINNCISTFPPRDVNSVFIPSKEVLSLYPVILKSRNSDRSFGFDDTYFDLAMSLDQPVSRGEYPDYVNKSKARIEGVIGGKIVFEESKKRWVFQVGNSKYSIGITSEGIKKIAILDTLLSNNTLQPGSLLLIDEPEAALHPSAISQLMEILLLLAESEIQIFISSHSYFVIKRLLIIAQRESLSIPVLSMESSGIYSISNLVDGMPDNPIIEESINIYKEEIDLI